MAARTGINEGFAIWLRSGLPKHTFLDKTRQNENAGAHSAR